jgi:nucleotide-binding universal stress UspA family protein
VPMRDEESSRLEKEEAELQESVPHMERALVVLDGTPNGRLAGILAGLFAGQEQLLTTLMERHGDKHGSCKESRELLTRAAGLAFDRASQRLREDNEQSPKFSLAELVSVKPAEGVDAVDAEVMKGYSIAFIGIERPIAAGANHFADELQRVVRAFGEPVAISLNGDRSVPEVDIALNILVPTGGTPEARLAMEIGLSLAKASAGRLTALHVLDPQGDAQWLRGRARRQGLSLLDDARRLGKLKGVPVNGVSVTNSRPEIEIRRMTRTTRYDLVVIGTSLRRGETMFLSSRTTSLVRSLRRPVLLITRYPRQRSLQ